MEDLKDVVTPGAGDAPPVDPTGAQTATDEEKDLTDEELQQRIETLKEEAKKEEDPVAKRHKEQEAGWHMKVAKERWKAKELAEANRKAEESANAMENVLVEDAFEKIQSDEYGLAYLEKLAQSNPKLAEKVTRKYWDKGPKELILETKRKLAEEGDEGAKKLVTEEDIRASEREKVLHELSVQGVEAEFSGMDEAERKEAKEYFDEISEGKKLTPEKAKRFAEMAKTYALRNRKPEDKDPTPKKGKDEIMADKASTSVGKSAASGSETEDSEEKVTEANRQALLNAGIPLYKVNQIYPLKK